VHYPLRRGELFNLVAVFHSGKYDEGWNTVGDSAELSERFSDACPQVRQLLGTIETWNVWVLCDRKPVKDWIDRRVNLLGEAPLSLHRYQQVRCMRCGNCVIKCFKAARKARDLQV
jgi:salicylate hydroxylase